jgi:acetylornithine/N-succinyldiaminopimelate aminotransferase
VMVYGEFIQAPQSRFAKLLCDQLPGTLDRVYFVNSGTEAVEGALKLAKKYTGRHKLAAFHNSYHGDTHGSLSVTGRDVYRNPYKPLLPDVHFSGFNDPAGLEQIDKNTAAVILEPIQGEGGVIPADPSWLKMVRKRCDETGTLLIFDEIQTGFFRTGSLFAFQHYNVVPDILCLAKAMGGGMPMGAFVSSTEIFEVFKHDPPLNHVTTFGGHPVSCAAAHANLETLLAGDFGEKAAQIEKIAREILKGEGIEEIRGRGAMLGLQLRDAELTQKVVKECFERGLILGWTLHSNSLIRIAPPLIIDQDLLESSFRIILEAID